MGGENSSQQKEVSLLRSLIVIGKIHMGKSRTKIKTTFLE
jgi:hypothetical protein